MTTDAEGKVPKPGKIISPGPSSEHVFNVEAAIEKQPKLTPWDRSDARANQLIKELKDDKESLQNELHTVRYSEIHHLRDDVRWLESRETSLLNALTLLRTSYDWAISFNWYSVGLITIGGCFVSFAAFLPAPQFVATFALAALLIGVIMQAIVSYRGTRSLMENPATSAQNQRPSPNPLRSKDTSPR